MQRAGSETAHRLEALALGPDACRTATSIRLRRQCLEEKADEGTDGNQGQQPRMGPLERNEEAPGERCFIQLGAILVAGTPIAWLS